MTKKIYKTAMGKTVDISALILQNENVRAVGNMNVNARGDLVDSTNQTIDKKNRQVQRQYAQTTSSRPIPHAQPSKLQPDTKSITQVHETATVANVPTQTTAKDGLAVAMDRSRATKK